MRVSPCAWVMDRSFYARAGMWPSSRRLASFSAEVTHNHPEGIKGAMATADAIFLCRFYFGGYCSEYEQPINDNPTECKKRIKDYIEKEYGDSDTLAAITGSIAEAAYGIPDWIKEKSYSYLDEPLKDVLRRWDNKVDVK